MKTEYILVSGLDVDITIGMQILLVTQRNMRNIKWKRLLKM